MALVQVDPNELTTCGCCKAEFAPTKDVCCLCGKPLCHNCYQTVGACGAPHPPREASLKEVLPLGGEPKPYEFFGGEPKHYGGEPTGGTSAG